MNSLDEKPLGMGLYNPSEGKVIMYYILAPDGLYYYRTNIVKGCDGKIEGIKHGHQESDFDGSYERLYDT